VPDLLPAREREAALMAYFGRTERARRSRALRERENAWVICPTHGGYNPWQRTLGGMRRGECPKCQAERYEAAMRG